MYVFFTFIITASTINITPVNKNDTNTDGGSSLTTGIIIGACMVTVFLGMLSYCVK